MTRTDIAFVAAAAAVLTSLTVVAGPGLTVDVSLGKLKWIGQVAAMYQADNRGYLPLTMLPFGQPGSGWCSWSYGGKNCDAYWISANGGIFDPVASRRPLNGKMYPGRMWKYAGLVPSNGRHIDQAQEYQDPVDSVTYQRTWPIPNPNVSTYTDVGTSYLANMAWFSQVATGPPARQFAAAFNEGTRRISVTERLTPSRFVWNGDNSLDVVTNQTNRNYQLRNGWGDINKSCVLFLDGHASYHPCPPGNAPDTLRNANYDLIFNP